MSAGDPIIRWNMRDLLPIVPNSSRRFWQRHIPGLIAAGALKPAGKCWIGRRSAIEQALLAEPMLPPTTPTPI